MTREEAISVLHKIKPTLRRADGKSTTHILETIALDLAIKALEQEPCDDIKEYYKDIWDCDINHPRYEDTVAEIVEKSYMSGYVQGVENTAKEFRFELEKEPCDDISKKERWIPCSERLPEDFQRVLVTVVNYKGHEVVRVAEYYKMIFQIKENHEQWEVGEKGLLAWMPLPEPYNAETEREE